jgi:hypothetical protein
MFSALSQGSLIHILDKTDGLKYKVGEVIGVTQPKTNFGGAFGTPSFNTATINLKVKIDGNTFDYPDVPSTNSVMSYNNGKIVISETKQGLQTEVETVLQNSKQILSNRSYYEQSVKDCETILKELNPQFAKDKERDDIIDGLTTKVTGMEDKLDKILNVLSTSNNTIKL